MQSKLLFQDPSFRSLPSLESGGGDWAQGFWVALRYDVVNNMSLKWNIFQT